jgi:hypothetical protein
VQKRILIKYIQQVAETMQAYERRKIFIHKNSGRILYEIYNLSFGDWNEVAGGADDSK